MHCPMKVVNTFLICKNIDIFVFKEYIFIFDKKYLTFKKIY